MKNSELITLLVPDSKQPNGYSPTPDGVALAWFLFTHKMSREEAKLTLTQYGLLLQCLARYGKVLADAVPDIENQAEMLLEAGELLEL